MSSSCSTRPPSPPTSFIRAPGSRTLNTRVLAVLVSHSRTTSPTAAVKCKIRVAAHQKDVAETAHRRVAGLGAAERRDSAVLEQQVVQRENERPGQPAASSRVQPERTTMLPYRPSSWV